MVKRSSGTSTAGEEPALKQHLVLWQAQDAGLVAGTLLGKATPVYLSNHVLFWGIQWSVERTCWNSIKRWFVEIKPDKTGATGRHIPHGRCGFGYWFSQSLGPSQAHGDKGNW